MKEGENQKYFVRERKQREREIFNNSNQFNYYFFSLFNSQDHKFLQ